jgi:ABC-type transporter Mla subunit MlaD
MTEPLTPNPHDEPTPDETFTWTGDQAGQAAEGHADHADHADTGSTGSGSSTGSTAAGGSATAILEQLREAVDDLAERASPTVREFSARAAELAATAADRAAPLAKRAGEATSDASGKLAEKSRTWASEIRASMGSSDARSTGAGTDTSPGATPPPSTPDAGSAPSDHTNIG